MIDRILLDIDGCLADFLGAVCKFHGKTYAGHPHDPETQTEQTSWDIEPIFQMSSHNLWEPLGYEFWLNVEPLPWCHEVISLLSDRFGEDNICLLTSPIRTDGCIDGKMAWIRKHIPQFGRRFLMGPKKQFCAAPNHCLIDDHDGNITAFKDAGGQAFLFPAPYNHRFKAHPVEALKEWLAALDVIQKS